MEKLKRRHRFKKHPIDFDKYTLYNLYVMQNMSGTQIGLKFNVSYNAVRYKVRKFGLIHLHNNERWVRNMFLEKQFSKKQIAAIANCSETPITRTLEKMDLTWKDQHLYRDHLNRKYCRTCNQWRDEFEFWKNERFVDGLNPICSRCHKYKRDANEKLIENNQKYKNLMKSLKLNGCSICGYDRCVEALVFHHVNPDDKFSSIRNLIKNNYPNQKIVDEINKCMVLCSNCHREVHYNIQTKKYQ